MTTLHGLYVPMITPFDASGEVALDALERLAHDILDDGATGLVALGTTAEPSTLTGPERAAVLELLTAVCRDRGAPVIVGANDAAALRALPEVTAALTLVPPFLRPGEDGVVAYLTGLAAASPAPIVLYHVPYRTGQPLSANAVRRIAAIGNVIGVKYAAGGIDAATVELMADLPPGFAVLAGDDMFIAPMLALGAHGAIAASAHVATAGYAKLIEAGGAPGHRLALLSAALFAEPNPTVIKGVLHAQGRIPTAAVRLPLLPASAGSVGAALRAGMLDGVAVSSQSS
ncbi:MAG: dihydrodipicolinate synthase family protein [Actinoplanes sp.]